MTGPESELRHSTGPERTVEARDLETWRPAKPNQPRQRSARPVLREVTNGIVCFCGQRFSEDQALDFMLHLRAEVGEVLDWRTRVRLSKREQARRRRADPEGRERLLQNTRNYRARQTPEERERAKQLNRESYAARMADPAYRQRANQKVREWRARKSSDPAWREEERQRHQARRAALKARKGGSDG